MWDRQDGLERNDLACAESLQAVDVILEKSASAEIQLACCVLAMKKLELYRDWETDRLTWYLERPPVVWFRRTVQWRRLSVHRQLPYVHRAAGPGAR